RHVVAAAGDRGDDALEQRELQRRTRRPDLAEREIAELLSALEERHEARLVEARLDLVEKRAGKCAYAENGGRRVGADHRRKMMRGTGEVLDLLDGGRDQPPILHEPVPMFRCGWMRCDT